jgi:ubiquitin carboxyl-terminal hydrolase L5
MTDWCTIESDPGVFTELVETMGVKGVQFEEVYTLDSDSMQALGEVHGLIFLFKWEQGLAQSDDRPVASGYKDHVFFAKQVITNACATQAILSVLLNSENVDLGDELSGFKSFTKEFDAETKGLALSNSDLVRTAHNSFAAVNPFASEEKRMATKDDDLYHFIAYVPVGGKLYELDGLKPGPILLGEVVDRANWTDAVQPHIAARIEKYSASEIRFNLMAVVASRLDEMRAQIASLPADSAALPDLEQQLRFEEQKRSRWKAENLRRKHNYLPFLINLLRELAKKGQLLPLLDAAKERARAKAAAGGGLKRAR